VRDLLGKDQTASLDVKERPDIGVYVKDLSSFVVHSPNEMDKLMSFGNRNRVTAATNMNEHSSRSHAIYTITLECSENAGQGKTLLRQGKLHLVDLAIANIAPSDYNYEESLSTLRYANRAKNIRNNAKINEDPKDAMLRQFQKEIEQLRKQLEEGGSPPTGLEGGMTTFSFCSQTRLEQKEAELKKAKDTQANLMRRMEALQSRIIVGGENLLEKAEAQERLLEQSAIELERQQKRAEQLHQKLKAKEEERINIEEKYNSLQVSESG
ncbi:hypothetical protein AHF37_07054, partial [Paragonimus kellicotti]